MKKLFILLFISFCINSCSLDDGGVHDFLYVVVPVDSVEVPTELIYDEVNTFIINYTLPSNCHAFKEFYYSIDENTRTVAIISFYTTNAGCEDISSSYTIDLDFIPTSYEPYTFKFWLGEDEQGIDIYEEYLLTVN